MLDTDSLPQEALGERVAGAVSPPDTSATFAGT